MYIFIGILLLYALFVYAAFHNGTIGWKRKRKSKRTRAKFAQRVRDLFDESDNQLD